MKPETILPVKIANQLIGLMMTISTECDEVVMHRLRVLLKRMNYYSIMIKEIKPDYSDLKLFRVSDQLRIDAGNIRKCDVNIRLLEEHDKSYGVNELLDLQYRKRLRLLKRFVGKRNDMIGKMHKSLSEVNFKNLNVNEFRLMIVYFAWKDDLIHMSAINDKKHFHEIRKQIKKVVYINESINKTGIKFIDTWYGAHDLDRIQDIIGQWHDLIEMKRLLKGNKPLRPLKELFASEAEMMERKIKKLISQLPDHDGYV
jgi:CHAD domain-containing protein